MIVPCMVNSWLYCSCDRNCWPGYASSARISNAITPPTMKNANDVTRYRIPICFGSVVRNQKMNAAPLAPRRAAPECMRIGAGFTAVMASPAVARGNHGSPPPTEGQVEARLVPQRAISTAERLRGGEAGRRVDAGQRADQ